MVSILIPAFNAERWVAQTLESALAQTWSPKEIIVVDDGSTDRTAEILHRYKSAGVRVIRQPNRGSTHARNTALSCSRGDYIQWLDADDLLAQDKIEAQMRIAESDSGRKWLLSSAWGQFLHRPSQARFEPTELWQDLDPMEWLVKKWALNLYIPPNAWLVGRALTQVAGPWNETLSMDDDGEYFCRVVLASEGVRFVPQARVYYRRRHGSLSYIGRSDRKLEAQFASLQLQVQHLLRAEDSSRVREACLRCLQVWLAFFYPERPDLVSRLQRIALGLGASLPIPRLPWKYRWLLGWRAAKLMQMAYNWCKMSMAHAWDRFWFVLEGRSRLSVPEDKIMDAPSGEKQIRPQRARR